MDKIVVVFKGMFGWESTLYVAGTGSESCSLGTLN